MKWILLLLLAVCFAPSDLAKKDDECGEFFVSHSLLPPDVAEYFEDLRDSFAGAECHRTYLQR